MRVGSSSFQLSYKVYAVASGCVRRFLLGEDGAEGGGVNGRGTSASGKQYSFESMFSDSS